MNTQPTPLPAARRAHRQACVDGLHDACEQGLPCLVVTGDPESGLSRLTERFVAEAPCEHAAHIKSVCQDPHEFLETVLKQFGFEPFAAATADLMGLLRMFLLHEGRNGRRALLAIEHADRFGPEVLDLLQTLITLEGEESAPLCVLLTGRPGLNRVLDSPGMEDVAEHTGTRWQLVPSNAVSPLPVNVLMVSRDGELLGHLELDRPRLLIGRLSQNDLSLDSKFVSRHHAMLVTSNDGVMLVDLNSTNGSYVNSIPVKQHYLRHGDVVCIGSYRLKYLCADSQRREVPPIVTAADTQAMRSIGAQDDDLSADGTTVAQQRASAG